MAIRPSASPDSQSSPQRGRVHRIRLGVIVSFCMAASVSGCALQPIHPAQIDARVDPISIQNHAQYRVDVDECSRYANDSLAKSRDTAVAHAVVGGLIGALIGQAIGGGRRWADTPALRNTGAAYGALAGGSQAVVDGANRADNIVLNCLIHRGYALLY